MPFPIPSRTPSGAWSCPHTPACPAPQPGLGRRSMLASAAAGAAGAALLAGCSSGADGSGKGSTQSAAERVRARAARDSAGLVDRYDAVLAAYPGLARRLRPLRAEVVRHVEAFGGTAAASPKAARGSGGSGGASPSVSPSPAVPGTEKEALTGLAAAERSLADQRTTALLQVPGELARLLASVAAAGAAHAYLLTEGDR